MIILNVSAIQPIILFEFLKHNESYRKHIPILYYGYNSAIDIIFHWKIN